MSGGVQAPRRAEGNQEGVAGIGVEKKTPERGEKKKLHPGEKKLDGDKSRDVEPVDDSQEETGKEEGILRRGKENKGREEEIPGKATEGKEGIGAIEVWKIKREALKDISNGRRELKEEEKRNEKMQKQRRVARVGGKGKDPMDTSTELKFEEAMKKQKGEESMEGIEEEGTRKKAKTDVCKDDPMTQEEEQKVSSATEMLSLPTGQGQESQPRLQK